MCIVVIGALITKLLIKVQVVRLVKLKYPNVQHATLSEITSVIVAILVTFYQIIFAKHALNYSQTVQVVIVTHLIHARFVLLNIFYKTIVAQAVIKLYLIVTHVIQLVIISVTFVTLNIYFKIMNALTALQ